MEASATFPGSLWQGHGSSATVVSRLISRKIKITETSIVNEILLTAVKFANQSVVCVATYIVKSVIASHFNTFIIFVVIKFDS